MSYANSEMIYNLKSCALKFKFQEIKVFKRSPNYENSKKFSEMYFAKSRLIVGCESLFEIFSGAARFYVFVTSFCGPRMIY